MIMKYKFSAIRFEKEHGNKGGLAKLVSMRINGATFQEIGDYFGLTRNRISQICQSLIESNDLPSIEEIELEYRKKKVAEATQNKS